MMKGKIAEILKRSGAIAAGVAEAGEVDEGAWNSYLNWISRGCHAGMEYMTRHQELRHDPRLLLPDAKSIISLSFPFKPAKFRNPEKGMIACYAYGDDYHDFLRKRLQEATTEIIALFGGIHRICIDSAPVMERYWAVKCGIGKRGCNGAIIVPGAGSMNFLAEIITTLDLTPGLLFTEYSSDTVCTNCGTCINRCPAGAISPDGCVDARRCLSYLTIEHRGPWLEPEAMDAISSPDGRNTIFGCDLCLRSCYLNESIPPTSLPELYPRQEVEELSRDKISGMTQEEFSRIFRGSPIKRCKLNGLKRNIGIESE